MDGLSGAASIIAVIDISAKIASLCFQYSIAVKDAKKDIERLQGKVTYIKEVLGGVKQLLDRRDNTRLSTTHKLEDSLKACFFRLEELKTQLDPGKTRKAMRRLGVRALKWPFTSGEVEKIVVDLEGYEQTFLLALQVDQTGLMLDFDQKMDLVDKKTDGLHQKTNELHQKTDSLHQQIDLAKLPIAKGASFDSHMEEHNARCLENTRVELQRHIAEWAKDRNGKPVFWLSGMAGTGKSTIARTVAQSFADKGQLGASFFFKKGEGDRGNAARFFTTIATDLMVRIPGLMPGIKKAIDADPSISEKALKDQFEKLILQSLLQIRQAAPLQALKLVVVIDALDECDREEDIRTILLLLAQIEDIMPVSLRVFLTSRPELPIRLGFKQMSDGTYQDLILHEVPKPMVERDIARFLEHELGEIRKQRSLSLDWPGKNQIRALVEIAIPLFIFAATACRYIGDKRGNPKNRLDTILQYQTASVSKLDRTYLPILNQLFDEEDEVEKEKQTSEFREIVGSIVILESPLPIFSLAHLFDIPKEDISCRLDLLHSVLSIPVDKSMPVSLLHLSFRDFLLDPQKRGMSPFWVDEKKTHERLTSKCLQLMSDPTKGLRQNMCNLSEPGTLRSEIDRRTIDRCLQPEVQYACRYWVHHLKQGTKNCIHDGDPVSIFLEKSFLYWLEAMSLIGEVSESIRMINNLQLLLNLDKSATMLNFLRDAKRFALRNRSILENTPLQLYASALIFAPEKSTIRKRFNDHIPKWFAKLSKAESDWNASLQTLEGHSDRVSAVAFSLDGSLVASGSFDRTVRLWDAATGSCRSTLEGHSNMVSAVAFSLDSQLVASGSNDRTVRLWDAATGSCRSTLEGHSDRVSAVAFSPDSQLVASGSNDRTVRLWDAATGSCRSTLEGHSDRVSAVAFSLDGSLVASGSFDRTVRLWDAATGSCRSTLEGHSDRVSAVAFSSDSQVVASGSNDRTVRLWDAATGSCRSTLEGHSHRVNAAAFSPDSQLVASGSHDCTVRLWDAATGSCPSTLEGHSSSVNALAFSLDGSLVASGSDDRTVRLWDAATGSCRSTLEGHSSWVNAVALSPDSQLVASGSDDHTVRLWDAATGSCRSTLEGHSNRVSAVAFSPDSQVVASGSYDDTVRLWNAATGSCRSTLEGHSNAVNAVAFSPDSQLVASGSYDHTVRLWDAATGSRRSTLEGHSRRVRAVAFSPDSQLVASGSSDDTVRLWDAATGSCRSTLEGHSNGFNAVAFSPDSQLVASGSDDRTVRLWDAATGSCRSTLEGHSDRVSAVAFSPDSQLVASGSYDRTIRLWDAATGSCRSTLEGHSNAVNAAAFSPDSQLVASGSYDHTVRLWDAATGSCRSTLQGEVSALAFSSDGSHLITDTGNISLPSHLFDTTSYQKKKLRHLFANDQWVYSGEQRLLWLPTEYRSSRAVAVSGNFICLGHESGQITILKFDLENMSPQKKLT